jgi:hypothetical protein
MSAASDGSGNRMETSFILAPMGPPSYPGGTPLSSVAAPSPDPEQASDPRQRSETENQAKNEMERR